MDYYEELFGYETFFLDNGGFVIGKPIHDGIYFIYAFYIPKESRKGLDTTSWENFIDYLKYQRGMGMVTGTVIKDTHRWKQRLVLHIKYLGYELCSDPDVEDELVLRRIL